MPACSSDGREDGRWAKGETGSWRDAEGLSSSPAVKAGCGDPAVGVFIFRYRVKVVCLDNTLKIIGIAISQSPVFSLYLSRHYQPSDLLTTVVLICVLPIRQDASLRKQSSPWAFMLVTLLLGFIDRVGLFSFSIFSCVLASSRGCTAGTLVFVLFFSHVVFFFLFLSFVCYFSFFFHYIFSFLSAFLLINYNQCFRCIFLFVILRLAIFLRNS